MRWTLLLLCLTVVMFSTKTSFSIGPIVNVNVSPASVQLTTDDSQQFIAMGYDSTGDSLDITDSSATSWSTSEPGNSITTGLYSPDSAGIFIVYAINGGIGDTSTVTVNPGVLNRLIISPNSASITADDSLSFSVTGYDANSNVTTNLGTLNWSGGTSIGIIDSTTGLFIATTWGIDSIIVSSSINGVKDTSSSITVTHGAIVRLYVTPDSVGMTTDSSIQFSARAYDADSNVWDVTGGVSSSWGTNEINPDKVGSGKYDPNSVGTFYVWAIVDSISDTAVIIVSHGAIDSIAIAPKSDSIAKDDSLQLIATAYDADSNPWDVTASASSIWGTTEPGNTVTNGLYSPDSVGTYYVYVSNGGYADTSTVSVNSGVTVVQSLMRHKNRPHFRFVILSNTIKIFLENDSDIKLQIATYDLFGRVVSSQNNIRLINGMYSVPLDGKLRAGMYFVTIEGGEIKETIKTLIIR